MILEYLCCILDPVLLCMKFNFTINLVSVIGHYFMSQIASICKLPFMTCSRRGNDIVWHVPFGVVQMYIGTRSTFMSCHVQWFLWDLRQNLFPSLRLVLIHIVCADVWTNSIVVQGIVFCLKNISIRISIFAKFNNFWMFGWFGKKVLISIKFVLL